MNDKTPTIFVVQENQHADYSDAERYGNIVFMTSHEYKPVAGSPKNEMIKSRIRGHLSKYTPDDFLVLTGNPTVIGYAFHIAAQAVVARGGNNLRVLQWDKMTGAYRPSVFILDTIEDSV